MKSTVAAATALVLAIAATTASAGVVISQEMVFGNPASEHKFDQTVMIQGHKQKIITGDREVIIDVDAGKMYLINPAGKQSVELPFPPGGVLARSMMLGGLSTEFKKTGGTHKVAGYDCQDYTGHTPIGYRRLNMTECVASDAPGAKEFVEFQKAMADKLKRTPLKHKGEIPDGIPVSSIASISVTLAGVPRGMAPEQAAKLKAQLEKQPPTTNNTTVSKIQVKDLPADTFVVPAGYQTQAARPGTHPVTPGSAPVSPGSSTKAAAPAAPAPPAAP